MQIAKQKMLETKVRIQVGGMVYNTGHEARNSDLVKRLALTLANCLDRAHQEVQVA